jgi:hypothetical protein
MVNHEPVIVHVSLESRRHGVLTLMGEHFLLATLGFQRHRLALLCVIGLDGIFIDFACHI